MSQEDKWREPYPPEVMRAWEKKSSNGTYATTWNPNRTAR